MYRKQVRRRRTVLVALIVASLVLLSLQFSEAESGPLHSAERAVATVLSPLESVASAALKPGRDLVNWFDETFDARGENDDLRAEVAELRAQLVEAQRAVGENEQFHEMLNLSNPDVIAGYEPVTARVIARNPSVWNSTVNIDRGTGDGIEVNDPVVTGDVLVGQITDVTGGTAQVELITDHRNAVSALVLPDGPQGMLAPEAGDPDDLILDFIENGEAIEEGDILVTAGWSNGEISSAYPYGLEIGRVSETTIGEQDYQRISVEPFADMRALQYVQVLTGGPERPGVPG